jgi:hypothetical protein
MTVCNQIKIVLSTLLIFSFFDSVAKIDSTYFEKKISGDYYPYYSFDENDTLKFPLKIDVSLFIKDLQNLNLKDDFFYVKLIDYFYFDFDSVYTTNTNDTIEIWKYYPNLQYPEDDKVFIGDIYYFDNIKSKYAYNTEFEGILPHKWDLKNYPFDTQELKIQYLSWIDTSIVLLAESKTFKSVLNQPFDFLNEGFTVDNISSEISYVEQPSIIEFPDAKRNEIYQMLTFNIEVSRKGSYLYFKLFFGAFLSFIISYLAFFIPKEKFESRITLCIGSVFGAVGNKYFVESTMPEIQVLTKADLINNLTVLLIIINILIVICQNNDKINIGIFEKNKFASFLSLILFFVINLLIIKF